MLLTELAALAWFVATAVVEVLPAFALSIALAVGVRALRLEAAIRRAFRAREGVAVLLATAVGAFSPLCSCTVIPVVSGLLASGVPLAPVMAFWIASPTMDPEMFALTVATLGWPVALARLGATVALSLGAGYLTLGLSRSGLLPATVLRESAMRPVGPAVVTLKALGTLRPSGRPGVGLAGPRATVGPLPVVAGGSDPGPTEPGSGSSSVAARLRALPWARLGRDFLVQGGRLGRWLLLAFVLEALILRYVPQDAIAGTLGGRSPLVVVLAALVGVPLYLNNASALPIVSGLLAQGMQPGAAVAFLIAGPVTTVPAMAAVWGVTRRPVFALYLGISFVGAVALGFLANLVLG
jgi:hypothetical protein